MATSDQHDSTRTSSHATKSGISRQQLYADAYNPSQLKAPIASTCSKDMIWVSIQFSAIMAFLAADSHVPCAVQRTLVK